MKDLVRVAEKECFSRETEKEKEESRQKEQEMREWRWDKRHERNMQKILATIVREGHERSPGRVQVEMGNRRGSWI